MTVRKLKISLSQGNGVLRIYKNNILYMSIQNIFDIYSEKFDKNNERVYHI